MNNSIANATSIDGMDLSLAELIHIAYLNYVIALVDCGCLGLLIYAMILAVPREVMYMWLSPKPFTLPSLLYALTRYTSVLGQAVNFWFDILSSESLCNFLAYTGGVATVLTYIGGQGLLVLRAYSLCQGNKVVIVFMILFFGGGVAFSLYEIIKEGGCQSSGVSSGINLAQNICTILTDLTVFGTCLLRVWGTWKLKRATGIQSHNDLISLILKQTVTRFCYVIISNPALIIVDQFKNQFVVVIIGSIQRSLSAILIADFTLDLRQENSTAIQAADIQLPTIQFRSMANYIHRSILVEMGDHEISVSTGAEENDDLSTESPDVGIGSGNEASSAAA